MLLRTAPILAIAAALCLATASSVGSAPPSMRQAIGQLMLVRMHGRTPSAFFLARIRRGQIGGVVLFADTEEPTATDGWVAIKIQTTKSLPHKGSLVMQIRARGPGNSEEDILGGISTRRLVQVSLK